MSGNKFKVGSCWKESTFQGTSMFQVVAVEPKIMGNQVYFPLGGLYAGGVQCWHKVEIHPSELAIAEPFSEEKFHMMFSLGDVSMLGAHPGL